MKTKKFMSTDKFGKRVPIDLERYCRDAIADNVKRAFAQKRLRGCPHCGNCSVKQSKVL